MKVLFIIGLILYLTQDVYSIQCYECQSDESGVCGPNMLSDTSGALIKECKHECLMAHIKYRGHTIYDRKCVDAKFCEKIKTDKKKKYEALFCEVCNSDLCNGGDF